MYSVSSDSSLNSSYPLLRDQYYMPTNLGTFFWFAGVLFFMVNTVTAGKVGLVVCSKKFFFLISTHTTSLHVNSTVEDKIHYWLNIFLSFLSPPPPPPPKLFPHPVCLFLYPDLIRSSVIVGMKLMENSSKSVKCTPLPGQQQEVLHNNSFMNICNVSCCAVNL